MSRKKLLVTGSCGFIFSNFVRRAIHNKIDYDLVSVDKVLTPHSRDNIYVNRTHSFYVGDVADSHFINTIFDIEKPDIVIHGAAESFVDASIKDAAPFIHSNVLGTQVIVDACIRHKVDRLLYVSTDEVYGHLQNENETAWSETSTLSPRNPYSASKAAGEMIVQAAHHTHGLKYNITRSCNNYGPRQSARNLIPVVIKNILEGKPVPIYGQGKQMREWIYVDDHISALLTILDKAPANEIYNISSSYEFSNLEIFNEICNALGKGFDLLEFVKDRPGHDFRYACDSSKLRDLGWKPQFKFKEGLRLCTNWYEKNQWFLK